MAQFSFNPKLVVNQVVTRGVGYKDRLYDQVSKYSCLKILVKFYDCERVYMHDVAKKNQSRLTERPRTM